MNAVIDESNKTYELIVNPLWFDLDLAFYNQSYLNIHQMNSSQCTLKLPSYDRTVPSQWVKGEYGATCNATCASIDSALICDAPMQSSITSAQAIESAFAEAGYECKTAVDGAHRDYAGAPFSTGRDSDDCYYLTPNGTSVCDSNAVPHHAPLCFCRNVNADMDINQTLNISSESVYSFYGIHPCEILDADLPFTMTTTTTATPVATLYPDEYYDSGWIAAPIACGALFVIGLLYWKSTVDKQREQERRERATAEAAAAQQVQLAQQQAREQKDFEVQATTAGMENEGPTYDAAVQPSAPSEGNLVPGMGGNEVDDWMRVNCGIDLYVEYSELFKENGFDTLDAIKIMTDGDLEAIGVKKMGHRRVFNLKIQEL